MKTINRCALAALALVGTSAAFAQSSVTLYVSGQPCHLDGDVGSLQQPLISSTASPPS